MRYKIVIFAVAAAFAALCQAKPLSVGVFVDRGARGIGCARWMQIAATLKDARATMLDGAAVRAGALDDIDVLIMPGGRSVQEAASLGEEGAEAVKKFIRGGGGYIGTCAGCCLLMQPASHHPGMLGIIPYRFSHCGGSADMRIAFNERAENYFVKKGARKIHYEDGPVPVRIDGAGNEPGEGCFETIATYASDIQLDSARERPSFAGNAAAIAGTYGKGRVFVLSVHPEMDASNDSVIRGAFRYVAGREVEWSFPRRVRGQLAVGFVCSDSPGVETANIFCGLVKSGEFDIIPIEPSAIRSGMLSHLDAVLAPDSLGSTPLQYGLGGDEAGWTRSFLQRGGRLIAWGRGAKSLEASKIAGASIVADGNAALDELRRFALEEEPPRAVTPPPEKEGDPETGKIVKVAVFCGPGGVNLDIAPFLARTSNYDPQIVTAEEIRNGALDSFDLLLVPGGGGNTQAKDLGEKGMDAVRNFVRGGGLYYGICAGAFLAEQGRLGIMPFVDDDPEHYRGGAAIAVSATKDGMEIFPDWPKKRYTWYHGGPAFVPSGEVEDTDIKVVATYVGRIINTESPKSVKPMNGKAVMLAGRVGKGKIFICATHPEQFSYSFDIVEDALFWLTGVRPVEVERVSRVRGATSIHIVTSRSVPFAKLFMEKLSRDPRFDIHRKHRQVDHNILPHVEAVLITTPTKAIAKTDFSSFVAAGGKVIAIAASEKTRAAASEIKGAIVVETCEAAMAELEKVASARDDSGHERGNLQVAVYRPRASRAGAETKRAIAALRGVDVGVVDDETLARGVLQYFDVFVLPEGAEVGERARGEVELFREAGYDIVSGKDAAAAAAEVERLCRKPPAPQREWPVEKKADALKAVVYRDNGVSDDSIARLLDMCPEIDIRYASGEEIANGALEGAAMVVHAGGGGQWQYDTLGPKGVAAEREFIANGGLYHGTCAGAFLVLEPTRRRRNQMVAFKPDDPPTYRGGATVRLDFTDEGKAALGMTGARMVGYHGGPAMIPGCAVAGGGSTVLAYYGDDIRDIELPKSDIRSLASKAAIVGGTFGKGRLLITGPHPEGDAATYDIFYKGVEWLTGRKLTPARRWHRRGLPRVSVFSGQRTPEGGRLARTLWNERSINRIPRGANADILVLIDPKKKDIVASLASPAKKVVFARHPKSISDINEMAGELGGVEVFDSASKAFEAVKALR